jgi:hypothetical protein
MMHGHGKSDFAILAVKPANKAEHPAEQSAVEATAAPARKRTTRLGPTPRRPAPPRHSLAMFRSSAQVRTSPRRASGLLRSMSKPARKRTRRPGPTHRRPAPPRHSRAMFRSSAPARTLPRRVSANRARDARAQRGAHHRHSENLPVCRRCDSQPDGRHHDRAGCQCVPGLRAKGARSDLQGPGDVFLRRQSAVHANRCLSSKLCGMAHLPRDGTGCEKDGATAAVRAGSLPAAEGEPGNEDAGCIYNDFLDAPRPCNPACRSPPDRRSFAACSRSVMSVSPMSCSPPPGCRRTPPHAIQAAQLCGTLMLGWKNRLGLADASNLLAHHRSHCDGCRSIDDGAGGRSNADAGVPGHHNSWN